MEHSNLNVNAGGLLNELAFLIELGSFSPLLHELADSCNLNDHRLVGQLICNVKPALDVTHLDSRACNTCIALSVMLFNIDLLILRILRVEKCLLVELLGLDGVALVLNLRCQLPTDVLLFLRRNLLAEFEGCEPVLKVHAHLKRELGLRAFEEVVLSHVVLE